MDAETLVGFGFFPKELPAPFLSTVFAEHAESEGPLTLVPQTGQKAFISRPAVHNLARPGGQRRRLHIPNPLAYQVLCDLLERHWGRLEKHWAQSSFSVSSPVPDDGNLRAIRPSADGQDLARHRARVRSISRVIVRTDISRFYGSIYTHSIPWALESKAIAKRARKGGLGNELDALVRALQDGQTLGIPVGPDASLVIAEIIACAIDKQIKKAGLSGIRFMDDYELGFVSRASAESGLARLEEILAEFELAINPRKTTIDDLPVELDRRWNTELKTYEFRDEDNVPATALLRYFNRVFELKAKYPADAVLAYAVARLRSTTVSDWELFQHLLCQCVLAEPGAMEPVITQLHENRERGLTDALDGVIAATLDHHGPLSHGSEVAWALWAAIWFDRPIEADKAVKLDGSPDPVVALLALHARDRGLIKKSIRFPGWTTFMTNDSLYGSQWLLAYEADLKGWLPSAEKRNHVDSDSNYSALKDAGVSFYEPNVAAPTTKLLRAEKQEEEMEEDFESY